MQTEIAKHQSIIARCDNPEIKSSWEIDLQEQETDLQNFKVFNAMGESAPQFILALSILMKKGALHSWMYQLNPLENPLAFLQTSTSLLSTVLSVTGIFTDMPVSGVTPTRTFSYKFLVILPLMFLVATPRLLNLAAIYSLASIETPANCIFYSLLTLVLSLLYALSYFGICQYLKRQDKTLELSFLDCFTSIIAPCIMGSFYSEFYILTSLLSTGFHMSLQLIVFHISIVKPHWVMTSVTLQNIDTLHLYCGILSPLLLCSLAISFILNKLYLKHNQWTQKKASFSIGDEEAIRTMMSDSDINLNVLIPNDIYTPVTYAAKQSGLTNDQPSKGLKLFVAKHQEWNIDFNAKGKNEWNALMIAAYYGNNGSNVRLLLSKAEELRLNLNAIDEWGFTAFMSACIAKNPQVMVPFLEYMTNNPGTIDVNAINIWNQSAFHLACDKSEDEDVKMERLKLLLDYQSSNANMDLKSGLDLLTSTVRSKLHERYPLLVPFCPQANKEPEKSQVQSTSCFRKIFSGSQPYHGKNT